MTYYIMPDIKPKYTGWDVATCPVCDREFNIGWHHPADQKLYHHMRNPGRYNSIKEHLDILSTMTWPLNGGNIKYWEEHWYP